MSDKPRFGGLPFRAVADGELTALDLRVLAIIAAHDGFNKNRRGCFASHKRIASLAGAHYKSTARSITKLIERDYLDASQQGGDGRLRVYRVIYSEADHDAFRGDGRTHAPAKPLKSVTEVVTDHSRKSVTEAVTDFSDNEAEIGNRDDVRSVTETGEVGNRNDPENSVNALNANEKGNRIYYTESNNIKKEIDHAEAGLGEGEHKESSALKPPTDSRAADLAQCLGNALRPERPVRVGPATDADAEIDLAIARKGEAAPVEKLEISEPSDESARPSSMLLDNPLCRAARGVR